MSEKFQSNNTAPCVRPPTAEQSPDRTEGVHLDSSAAALPGPALTSSAMPGFVDGGCLFDPLATLGFAGTLGYLSAQALGGNAQVIVDPAPEAEGYFRDPLCIPSFAPGSNSYDQHAAEPISEMRDAPGGLMLNSDFSILNCDL